MPGPGFHASHRACCAVSTHTGFNSLSDSAIRRCLRSPRGGFPLSYRTAISRFFVSPYAKKRRLYHFVPALQGVFIKAEPLRVSTFTKLPLSACLYMVQFGKANELTKNGGMTNQRLNRKKPKVKSRLSNLRSRSAENRKTERRI